MLNRNFVLLFAESMRFKDWGMLRSSLAKREEATALMSGDHGYYSLGKANEATLLGHHIGDGLRAYDATKESLKDMAAFAEADREWQTNLGFSLLNDSLSYAVNYAESYEKAISYCKLAARWSSLPNIDLMIRQFESHKAKGIKWWEAQKYLADNFYSRNTQEKDAGKYAAAISILHCIIDRAIKEDPGYEMNSDAIFDILDDYISLTIQAYLQLFMKFRTALQNGDPVKHVDGAYEQFIIFENPLKNWLKLMPDCSEKDKVVLAKHYEVLMKSPHVPFPQIMAQIGSFFPTATVETKNCPYCGHANSSISPLCVKCGRRFNDAKPANKTDFRIDREPLSPMNEANPYLTQQPPGCFIASFIFGLFVSIAAWWWAVGQGQIKGWWVFFAIIFSLSTLQTLLLVIKMRKNKKN